MLNTNSNQPMLFPDNPNLSRILQRKTLMERLGLDSRWKKVWRDLWHNKTRSTLVILAIAVGVFSVGLIASASIILEREMAARYLASNPASAELAMTSFGNDLLQTIRNVEGVSGAAGRQLVEVQVRIGPEEWESLEMVALSEYTNMEVDQLTPESGAWPPPDDGILIERAAMELLGAQVGDTLLIELNDDRRREIKLAGTVHDITRVPANLAGSPYGFVTAGTLQGLGIPLQYDELRIGVTGDRFDEAHIESVVDEVEDKIERSGRQLFYSDIPTPGEHPLANIVQTVTVVLTVLGLVSLVVSAFLVYNTISAILIQQTGQIGIMKSIGGNQQQLIGMYAAVVFILGFLGSALAIPAAQLGARAMTSYVAGLLNFEIENFSTGASILLLELGIGVLVPLLSAWQPILHGVRITVREAITSRASGVDGVRVSRIEGLLQRYRLISRPFLLSYRNIFRRKGRFWLSLLTLALGAAVSIAVFGVRSSLQKTLDEAAAYRSYDLEVYFDRTYRPDELQHITLGLPGVEYVEGWSGVVASRIYADGSDGSEAFMLAPPADTQLLQPVLLDGRWLHPNDGNAIVVNSQYLEEEPDVAVGSQLTVKIDERESTWTVVGLVRSALDGPVLYSNAAYFGQVTRDLNHTDSLRIVTSQSDSEFQSKISFQLQEYYKQQGLQTSFIETQADVFDQTRSQFDILLQFLAIMAVLVIAVSCIGLTGTMSINVLERISEIGIMRAIGASNQVVLLIFMVEGALIGLLSWIIGGILAFPLTKYLSDTMGSVLLEAPLSFSFPLSGLLLGLVLIVGVATVATIFPGLSAARLSVREVLAYE